MKNLVSILTVLVFSFGFSQNERTLKFNENTNLIEVTYFHTNGTVSQTGYYTKAGKLEGKWYKFDAKGNKLVEATYDNGLKVGTWYYWIGNTIKTMDYTKNELPEVSK